MCTGEGLQPEELTIVTMVMLGTRLVCNIAVTWKPAWLPGWVGITAGCVHQTALLTLIVKSSRQILTGVHL